MTISVTYKRLNIFDKFELVTDSVEITSLKNLDKYMDAVFSKLAVDINSYVDIDGLKFFWNSDEDFNSDVVTFFIKGKQNQLSRNSAMFNAKKFIHLKYKKGGYDIEFD